jgi:competence protein ComEA
VELPEQWRNILTKLFLLIGIGTLSVGLYIQFIHTPEPSAEFRIEETQAEQKTSKDIQTQQNNSQVTATASLSALINIDVSGAVNKPGVVTLSGDARLTTALDAAGGLNKSADNAWVARNLNLATKLNDGDKVYIPTKGEIKPTPYSQLQANQPVQPMIQAVPQVAGTTTGTPGLVSTPVPIQPSSTSAPPSDGKINVNSATKAELDTLPGVGEITAQKIIDSRPYQKLEELKEKNAVNKSTYEKILDKIKL